MYKNILIKLLILLGVIVSATFYIYKNNIQTVGATTLYPSSGGTGLNSSNVTAGDVGKFLKLSDDSPMTYILDSVAGGSQTPWAGNINGATYSLSNVGSLSATSSLITQATSTNLAITGITSSLLKTNAGGSVVGATAGTDYVAPASLASYLTLSSWYATTTDGLAEGVSPSRLYFSNARAVSAMSGLYESPLTFNYPLSRSVNAISMVATSSLNLTVGTFLSPNISQWTNDSGYTNYSYPFPNNATSSNLTFSGLSTFANASTTGQHTVNELCFMNDGCITAPVSQGSGVELFPNNVVVDIGIYESLRTLPVTTAEVDESCSATSGYCAAAIDNYVSTTTLSASGALVINKIPAGVWRFDTYTYVNSIVGTSVLEYTVLRRTAGGTETQLFQATSTDINFTSVDRVQTNSTQDAFTFDPTDRIVFRIKGNTDSVVAKTIHFVYGGTSHYSHIETPITIASEAIAFLPSNNTFTGLNYFNGGLISNSSSTLAYFNSASSSIGTLAIPSLGSALMVTNSNGVFGKYAGASACTAGQAVTAISALGATTCTTVSSFAYPFTPTAIGNSTSTLMQFNGGLIAIASSTMQYLNTASTSVTTKLNIPYGSAPSVVSNGDIGIDSTSNQFKYQSGAVTQVVPAYQKAWAGFSTSTTWGGTTTVQGTPAFEAQTFVSALCYTDAGTVGVSLYDGQGNRADYFVASTATTSKTYTTNNTFYAGEKRYMDFGAPASSPTNVTCVFKTTITAD